jgi:metal-sulfur cluster biosynthetic enzyme
MGKTFSENKMDDDILCVLNQVEDPELGIGIVDVGLVYRAEWTEAGICVDVTTTVPSCPFATTLRRQVDAILRERFHEASTIFVQLVFEPPWSLDRLSEGARRALGWANAAKAPAARLALPCWSTASLRKH